MAHSSLGASPRQNFITWEKYFMGTAFLARQRSKGPDFQVGACIVDNDKKVVGIGWNGMPTGIPDEVLLWGKGTTLTLDPEIPGVQLTDSRKYFVCHAESNAIFFKTSADVKGCTMYTTLFPCNECAKAIIQSRIVKVIYFSDDNIQLQDNIQPQNLYKYNTAKTLLQEAEVVFEKYNGDCETIELNFLNENLSRG